MCGNPTKDLFSLQNSPLDLEEDLPGVYMLTALSPAKRGAAEQDLPQ